MNIRLLFLSLFITLAGWASGQQYHLETKATTSGTEVLIRAKNLMILRNGLQSGLTIEVADNVGNWKKVTTASLRAKYGSPEEIKGQDISQGERYLYRFVLFPSEAAVEKVEGGRLLTTIYRRLAEDRAGLQASGLWAKDETGQAASQYRLLDANGGVLATAPAPKPSPAPACSALKITPERNDQFITLSWPQDDHIAGYYLLKSVDGSASNRLREELIAYRDPGVAAPPETRNDITLLDSLPADGKTYGYQLVPVDHFGAVGTPCPEVTVKGRDLIAPALPIVYPAVVNATTNEVKLRWGYPEGERPARQRLLFAETQDGDFREMATLPVGVKEYSDRWEATQNRGFYRVEFADAAGNITTSGPVFALRPDVVPPPVPKYLKANLQGEVISISWEGVGEEKVGYRLRTRSGGSEQWTEIMRYAPTNNQALDTLSGRQNGGAFEYQLSAYDWIGNESDFCEPVIVLLPDNVAPVAPVLTGLRSVEDSIGLGWQLSNPEEVAEVIVEVAKNEEKDFSELRRLPATQRQLLLTKQVPGTYAFRLRAVDAAGNISSWSAVRRVTVQQRKETTGSGIASITHRAFAEGRILLQWEPADERVAEYLVFRQRGEEEAELAGMTATTQFSDVAPDGTSYFLIRQGADGQSFSPSETYSIK